MDNQDKKRLLKWVDNDVRPKVAEWLSKDPTTVQALSRRRVLMRWEDDWDREVEVNGSATRHFIEVGHGVKQEVEDAWRPFLPSS